MKKRGHPKKQLVIIEEEKAKAPASSSDEEGSEEVDPVNPPPERNRKVYLSSNLIYQRNITLADVEIEKLNPEELP